MMKEKPIWGKRVDKALIDKGMSKKELAKQLGVNYTQLVGVIGGLVINDTIKSNVCAYLGVKE